MKKVLAAILLALLTGCKKEQVELTQAKTDVFDNPYRIQILDEHEVRCISRTDTVVLYMENAYAFEEEILFIKK